MRPATHAEIREHLGHGHGSRKVKIGRDGRVTYYGSTTDTDRSHDYWHEGRYAEEYVVDDDGVVSLGRGPGRPLLGEQRRKRYQVMLEPRIAEQARKLGGDNLSRGLTLAVERASDNQTEVQK